MSQDAVQIKDKRFRPFISENEIRSFVLKIASEINRDYAGKNPVFIGVLNGSFIFAADLLREITVPCEILFVKLSSYHGTQSSGQVKQLIGLNENLDGRHVVIIEDIVDSGLTLHELFGNPAFQNVASLEVATAFFKPKAFQKDFKLRYIGKEVENDFILGYGLDYDGMGRNLKSIYKLDS